MSQSKSRAIINTPYYSKTIGELPQGCKMCVKGEKLVLYITGICPRHCWFCPLSETRKDKDVIYANEWKTDNIDEMIQEAKLCSSLGAGITGGDPLTRIDRTVTYIKALKQEFGKQFHIHLYTTFVLATPENLKRLYDAGLDEIRFHPDFAKTQDYEKIEFARKFDWDIGIEIPVIEENKHDIVNLIDYMDGKIKFLNLNELEISELNSGNMQEHQYTPIANSSCAIKGSSSVAIEIMNHCKDKSFSVHFCSSKLKDRVQMQNRLKRRAKNVATEHDMITDEGLLLRGIIYSPKLVPGLEYKKQLETINREQLVDELSLHKETLEKTIKGLSVIVDSKKLRLIASLKSVKKNAKGIKKMGLIPAMVEEYPTMDQFDVTIDFY